MEAETTDDYAEAAVRRIVEAFDPVQVILFGSRARGDNHAQSDTDLLVVLPEINDKREATVALRQLLSDLPMAKDVVVATPEEIGRRGLMVGTVLRPALREGTVLYMSETEKNDEVRRWLRYAEEDFSAARRMNEQGSFAPRQSCFQAQQAAEKAIKAVLVFLQTEFPFTHDLDRLRALLPDGWQVKNHRRKAWRRCRGGPPPFATPAACPTPPTRKHRRPPDGPGPSSKPCGRTCSSAG